VKSYTLKLGPGRSYRIVLTELNHPKHMFLFSMKVRSDMSRTVTDMNSMLVEEHVKHCIYVGP
jgi:hypothetical protein